MSNVRKSYALAMLLIAILLVAGCEVPSTPPASVSTQAVAAATAAPAVAASPSATAAIAAATAETMGTPAAAGTSATGTAGSALSTPAAMPTGAATTETMATPSASAPGSASSTPAAMTTPSASAPGSAAGTPSAMATPGTLASAGQAVNSVTYTAVDFGYQGPASIPGGWTQITLKNSGKSTHDLMLMKVAAGKTITDVITAIQGPSAPDWVQAFGGVTAEPGGSASYTVNLVPGNYVMLSFQQSGQNQPPDAARGMLEQITVTAPQGQASGASLPQPGAMIGMADYRFVITGTVGSGNQTLFLTNSGTETHEAVFLRLKAGKTMDDFRKALQAEESGQQVAPDQLPFDGAPQGTSLSPGVSAYINVNLPPGTYVLACFIPSIKNPGKSHADLGMAQELTVK